VRRLHRILYPFGPDDYREIVQIWNGPHPEAGAELTVRDGPPEGAPPPDLPEEPQLTSPVGPDMDPGMLAHFAPKLFG
jgi:Mn-containing catalase